MPAPQKHSMSLRSASNTCPSLPPQAGSGNGPKTPKRCIHSQPVLTADQRVSSVRSAAVLDDLWAHAVARRVLGAKAAPGMVIGHHSEKLRSAFKVRIAKVGQQAGEILVGHLLLSPARRGAVSSLILYRQVSPTSATASNLAHKKFASRLVKT
jgi:hypothetical protein